MNTELVIRWQEQSATVAQRRTLVDITSTLWALCADDTQTLWLTDAENCKHLFARLQRHYYPHGLKRGPFNLPPSNIRIVRADAHPLALYVATEEIVAALAAMGMPPAVTVVDISERFPNLAAPYWLQDCEDGDFVDFAMDAAGYEWTQNRVGPPRSIVSKTRYVYVLRGVEYAQRRAAIKELKARARRSKARE